MPCIYQILIFQAHYYWILAVGTNQSAWEKKRHSILETYIRVESKYIPNIWAQPYNIFVYATAAMVSTTKPCYYLCDTHSCVGYIWNRSSIIDSQANWEWKMKSLCGIIHTYYSVNVLFIVSNIQKCQWYYSIHQFYPYNAQIRVSGREKVEEIENVIEEEGEKGREGGGEYQLVVSWGRATR